ncbi:MAG: hypothetical protein C4520_08560 [Candidatus Abyssobacteria bacterium SURF_5]|uniref:TPM domain-containing protein n=1 Tax=Abyssobacteria bacterium (strain SURF_5) TaxID=2093360 RepID=A0A3A4NTV6_ABYX5|nr:MAG: hypothetical protein C4520_08560 [Candidatus Abyssubacteria bacterium SURF_5]
MTFVGLKKYISPLLLSLLVMGAGFAEQTDLDILGKALEKALGEKTNYGAPRIISIQKAAARGEHVLFVAVHVNRHFTSAGLRNNVLTDAASILRIAKSWGWSDRIAKVFIVENLVPEGKEQAHPVFSCSVSASVLAKVDWGSLNQNEVLNRLDQAEFHEVKK